MVQILGDGLTQTEGGMGQTAQTAQAVQVAQQALLMAQRVQPYQATHHKLVKGNYYEYNSKKN